MILPAFGIISEIIPVQSRKKVWGYKFIAYSTLSIAFMPFNSLTPLGKGTFNPKE